VWYKHCETQCGPVPYVCCGNCHIPASQLVEPNEHPAGFKVTEKHIEQNGCQKQKTHLGAEIFTSDRKGKLEVVLLSGNIRRIKLTKL
jgi:hypothetical protein